MDRLKTKKYLMKPDEAKLLRDAIILLEESGCLRTAFSSGSRRPEVSSRNNPVIIVDDDNDHETPAPVLPSNTRRSSRLRDKLSMDQDWTVEEKKVILVYATDTDELVRLILSIHPAFI